MVANILLVWCGNKQNCFLIDEIGPFVLSFFKSHTLLYGCQPFSARSGKIKNRKKGMIFPFALHKIVMNNKKLFAHQY